MEIARLQEETISALKTPNDRSPGPNVVFKSKPLLPTPTQSSKVNVASGTIPKGMGGNTPGHRHIKFIPAPMRTEKMAKGLCYYCDQPFSVGHKCGGKSSQLFLAELLVVEDKEEDSNEFLGEIDFDSEELEPQVSMNVMNGIFGFHTTRINGHMGKKTLH